MNCERADLDLDLDLGYFWMMGFQVCRHDIEGGLGQPGEGGCIYLEICTVSSVL